MIFAALIEAADRGELILMLGGMCRWHKRRDGVVVIREIIVMPGMRKRGIGRSMIDQVRGANPGATLRARCPARYESNGFWRGLGFTLVESGEVNVWENPS